MSTCFKLCVGYNNIAQKLLHEGKKDWHGLVSEKLGLKFENNNDLVRRGIVRENMLQMYV